MPKVDKKKRFEEEIFVGPLNPCPYCGQQPKFSVFYSEYAGGVILACPEKGHAYVIDNDRKSAAMRWKNRESTSFVVEGQVPFV